MKDYTNTNKFIKHITNQPLIKFNGGRPVCICNQCGVIIDRVFYKEDLSEYRLIDGGVIPCYCNICNLNK